MEIIPSERVLAIGPYAFAEVDRAVERLKEKGIEPIDFGVGDPTTPTPELIRDACKEAVDGRKSFGYPGYIGTPEFREAAAQWMSRRFGVDLDPAAEVTSTIGSKEAIFNFHEGLVNPGDVVLIPTPCYPPYTRGTLFAEGRSYFLPLVREKGFLPDLKAIPEEILRAAKLLWINYPNSPSGRIAPPGFFEEVVAFGRRHDVIIASDEAYSEIYFDGPPRSILEFARDGVVAFFSLSKRSAMTCYRVGWVAGDQRIVEIFKKVKTNIDSGTPAFIQDAAITALSDEDHVAAMRREYREKRDIMVEAFVALGLPDCTPEATLYIWQRVPDGMTSEEFTRLLLREDMAIVCTPGPWISNPAPDGSNPGKGHVRFALVPPVEAVREAARRIQRLRF
jgi:LL-diaminopimelate aminotransferase